MPPLVQPPFPSMTPVCGRRAIDSSVVHHVGVYKATVVDCRASPVALWEDGSCATWGVSWVGSMVEVYLKTAWFCGVSSSRRLHERDVLALQRRRGKLTYAGLSAVATQPPHLSVDWWAGCAHGLAQCRHAASWAGHTARNRLG